MGIIIINHEIRLNNQDSMESMAVFFLTWFVTSWSKGFRWQRICRKPILQSRSRRIGLPVIHNPFLGTHLDIYLEPKWPLFLKVNPQNKAFSNKNKSHLGSRHANYLLFGYSIEIWDPDILLICSGMWKCEVRSWASPFEHSDGCWQPFFWFEKCYHLFNHTTPK